MTKKSLLAACVLAALASPTFAAAPAKASRIDELEARIQALEANAQTLRQQAAEALAAAQEAKAALDAMKAEQSAAAETTEAEAPAPVADAGGANGNAFNPAMSIILNGAYAHNSMDPASYYRSGFPLGGGAGPAPQGLSIAESEVSLYADIDEKFFGQLTLTASNDHGQDHIGVENAYIETTSLPNGLGVRAGRFFSDIGYLNSHHAHTDSFYDRPLAYQAFLGGQYGDDGVQLHWLAPAPIFLQFGVEAFAGNNFPSGGGGHGGLGVLTGFVKAGGDINDDTSWLAGLSMLKSTTVDAEDGFSGDNKLYLVDGTIKWAPNGNLKDGGVTVRGEYMVDDRKGIYSPPLLLQPGQSAFAQPWNGQRRGGYLEAVYRINRTWELGYRYDKLWADSTGPYASNFDPSRNSVELSWLNSEFALIRLQLSHDLPNPFGSDNVLTLQYQVALGAHGAHAF
jgi:type II secretory pathway pseudopilin PulG